jgi:hypothetical protein
LGGLLSNQERGSQSGDRDIFLKQGGRYMSIWTILFVILLIAWISGFTVFHVAGGLIHLLLVFAVISLILHFVLGRSAA